MNSETITRFLSLRYGKALWEVGLLLQRKFQDPFYQCPDFQHQELRRKLKWCCTYWFTAPLGVHMAQLTLFLNPQLPPH